MEPREAMLIIFYGNLSYGYSRALFKFTHVDHVQW